MVEFIAQQKYDGLVGRPVRDMRANDIVTITTSGTVGAIGSTFANLNVNIDSSHEFYITNIYAHTAASAELSIQYGTGNTATMVVFYGIYNTTPLSISTNLDTPIGKVTGASTVSVRANAGQTACIWLSGVRFPISSKVEID